jgi:hypothetical protein
VSFARVRVDGRSYLRVVGHLRNVASYAGVAQSLRAVVMPTINGNTLIMTSDRGFGPELQKYTSSSGGYVDLACAGETQSYDNAADTITLRVPFSCVPSGFRTTVYGYATGTSYRNGKAGSDDDTDITAHQLDLG